MIAGRSLLRLPCRDSQVSADGVFHPASGSASRPIERCLFLEPPLLNTELQPIFKRGASAFSAAAIIVILPFLVACEATLPEVRIVRVPIVERCLKDVSLPQTPEILTNQELQKLNDFDLTLTIQRERLSLLTFSQTQSALLKACQ